MSEPVKAITSTQLLDWSTYPSREFMLIGGKDGVGKSSALVSIAWWIEQNKPDAKVYVMDSENKYRSALRGFGPDAPGNILYYKVTGMNEATNVIEQVMTKHNPGDWLFVESMGPIWDMAQDLAYQTIAGVSKAEYLDRRPKSGKGSGPIPSPDDFWKIAKGAYDSAFLDPIRQSEDLNVILTSVAKPIKEAMPGRKENQDRKAFRIESGMDMNLAGSPTMPSLVETLAILELSGGNVSCRILRDNLSTLDSSRIEFDIPGKRDFGIEFWSMCRNGEVKL